MSFGLALIVLRLVLGEEDQVGEELSWGISLTGAVGLLFVAVFLFQLIAAPSRLESAAKQEALTERSQLKGELEGLASRLKDKLSRQEISRAGGRLHSEGRELLHRLLADPKPNIERWGALKDEWRERATLFLDENVSARRAATWDDDHLLAGEHLEYNGVTYTGDKGRLAEQILLLLRGFDLALSGY